MGDDGGCGDETSDQQLHKAQAVRRGAEHVAKQLLARLDRCYTVVSDNTAASHNTNTSQTTSPWEELSLTSRTNRCFAYFIQPRTSMNETCGLILRVPPQSCRLFITK